MKNHNGKNVQEAFVPGLKTNFSIAKYFKFIKPAYYPASIQEWPLVQVGPLFPGDILDCLDV